MRTVKITVKHDGYNKVNHKRTFEVLDEIDASYLKDDAEGYTIDEITPDITARNESDLCFTHKFYRIEDYEDSVRYVAVPEFINYHVTRYPASISVFCEAFDDDNTVKFNIDMDAVNMMDDDDDKIDYIADTICDHIGVCNMSDWVQRECVDTALL